MTDTNKGGILPYVRLILGLGIVYFLSAEAEALFGFFEASADAHLLLVFFEIALICTLSFSIFYLASDTVLPPFVVAILFGIASKGLFAAIINTPVALGALVGFGATLILFGGGLETPWENFKKLVWKILSLSFLGLFVTAILFSLVVFWTAAFFGIAMSPVVAILLGAVLASTDPAAIIPILRELRFKNRDTKDIVVSESAMTDVTGTLLTVVLLTLIAGGAQFQNVLTGYSSLFSAEAGVILFKQLVFGVIFGVLGYALLEALIRFKRQHEKEFEVDAAYFFFVPIIIFTFALALGGSGYLAAFVAGLLFILTEHLHETEKFFNHTIEGFFKPTIFLLLGALVDLEVLWQYAGVGIVSALVFMLIIRPLVVFLTLGPFSLFGKERLSFRDLLFVSFVRETGAIPAVLLITIVSLGIPGLDGLVPIGMWVILLTLIIEPPLTPFIARKLAIATPMKDDSELEFNGGGEPFVVLGSRGRSYARRLPFVAEWAAERGIKRVILLHCLEDNHTPQVIEEASVNAEGEFAKINKERELRGKLSIKFSYMSRAGLLQTNIDDIARGAHNVIAIFVGRRLLDYRLSEIKRLAVPLFFIE